VTPALVRVRDIVRDARSAVAFSGAGVSAESGIATYRTGSDALWSAANFERFANPRGYRANLPDSYRWYRARAAEVAAAQPNPAHVALARLEAIVPEMLVVTQNVDGLHARAGSRNLIELHGHLREARCDRCPARLPWADAPDTPTCPTCGGMLRPDVVMFEEMLSKAALSEARNAARRCDVLLSIGTSAQVWPAAELPLIAATSGAWVIVINPDLAGQPNGDRVIGIQGRAGDIVPRLLPASVT
jgi:NAD-dependent deacetylase